MIRHNRLVLNDQGQNLNKHNFLEKTSYVLKFGANHKKTQ